MVAELSCTPRPDQQTRVRIGSGLLAELPGLVAEMGASRVVCLVDRFVQEHHTLRLPEAWEQIALPGGEAAKSFAQLESLMRHFARRAYDRKTVLVTIGGGTLGDLGGVCASLYLRGIRHLQVPTTLLAMLDSSVGGKTAINLPEGKNLVGSFWPAAWMLADLDLLASLPELDLHAGLAEAIKMAIGFDPELFALMEREVRDLRQGEPRLLESVIEACVRRKIETVEQDPFENSGIRQRLNLGHTLAHALEGASDYQLLHGLAVAQGLHFCLDVGRHLDRLDEVAQRRCAALLDAYGLVQGDWPPADDLLSWFARDKKMQAGELSFVVPTGIGSCEVQKLPLETLRPLLGG